MTTDFRLSIDKISITAMDHNTDRVNNTCDHLIRLADTDSRNPYRIQPGRWRRIQCPIPVPLSNLYSLDRVHIEVGARHPNQPDYRFEFNPSQLGADGLNDFFQSMDLIGNQLRDVFANGTVTRIDHALDLEGQSLENLIVRSRGAQKVGIYTDRRGLPETTYIGSPRSNRTIVYNKKSYDGNGSLRLERRMKPRCPVHNLRSLTNPFRKVQLISTKSFLPYLNADIAELFFDSIRIGGISRAVKKLPPGPRRAIKAMLRQPGVSILPDTDKVWMQFPQLLQDTGFGPFLIPMIANEASLVPDFYPAHDEIH